MATAADKIVILDGLQFTQETNAVIWTVDGIGLSCVKTYAIPCPVPVSGVRVLFNNNYDVGGAGRQHIRVRVTKLTSMANGTPTKTENTQALEWTALAAWGDGDPAAGVKETGEIDISAAIEAILHIDCIMTSTTAHTGTEIICQAQSEAGVDEWTTFANFIGPTGTCEAAGVIPIEGSVTDTTISLTNPVASNFDHVPKWIFFENDTITDCEIAYQTAFGQDA